MLLARSITAFVQACLQPEHNRSTVSLAGKVVCRVSCAVPILAQPIRPPLQACWRPELEKIVAKVTRTFSRSFAKIGCAGEVALHIADMLGGGVDYARCAINIKCAPPARQHCPCLTQLQHTQPAVLLCLSVSGVIS